MVVKNSDSDFLSFGGFLMFLVSLINLSVATEILGFELTRSPLSLSLYEPADRRVLIELLPKSRIGLRTLKSVKKSDFPIHFHGHF